MPTTPTPPAPRSLAVVGLGELLWDLLPSGRQLGGAPANFAIMAARLGAHGILLSRTGSDDLGKAARDHLLTLPADTRYLQADEHLPTGTVSVQLEAGQPTYTIHQPVAWDALELTPAWAELATRADAVCFGTLAQRTPSASAAVQGFLASTPPGCLRIFDINLREDDAGHFFGEAAIAPSLAQATLLKLNEGELPHLLLAAGLRDAATLAELRRELAHAADPSHPLPAVHAAVQALLARYPGLRLVVLTLGAHGSLLIGRGESHRHGGIPTQLVDAIGAGDAFTAALAVHSLLGASLARLNEAANRWGSWVASHPGATPPLDPGTLARIEGEIASA